MGRRLASDILRGNDTTIGSICMYEDMKNDYTQPFLCSQTEL